MLRLLRRSGLGLAVAVLTAATLVALAYGHRTPVAAQAFDPAAWALPDGTIPIICATPAGFGGDGHGPSGGTAPERCEACTIAAAAALPPPSASLAAPPPRIRATVGRFASAAPPGRPIHRILCRGPPAV